MREALARQPWKVVISDYHLPQFDAPAALATLQETGLDIPFIAVSGTIGEETAAGLMKAGAQDYLKKEIWPASPRWCAARSARRVTARCAVNDGRTAGERNPV